MRKILSPIIRAIAAAVTGVLAFAVFILLVWPLGSAIRLACDPMRLRKRPDLSTYRIAAGGGPGGRGQASASRHPAAAGSPS